MIAVVWAHPCPGAQNKPYFYATGANAAPCKGAKASGALKISIPFENRHGLTPARHSALKPAPDGDILLVPA